MARRVRLQKEHKWTELRRDLWLREVLAARIAPDALIRRVTMYSPCGHGSWDGYELTAEGRQKLDELEAAGEAAEYWQPVPPCMRIAAKGPWAAQGAGPSRDDAESSDDDSEEDEEIARDHAGYSHAILPPPVAGAKLSKGQAVMVFFLQTSNSVDESKSDWFSGTLTRAAAVGGSVSVRFSDGVCTLRLRCSNYGRLGMWVLPDATRAEQ